MKNRYIDEEFGKLDPWLKFHLLLFFFAFVILAGCTGYMIGAIDQSHTLPECVKIVNSLR